MEVGPSSSFRSLSLLGLLRSCEITGRDMEKQRHAF